MNEFKFKVGDIVKIINSGFIYSHYVTFFKKLNFKKKDVNGWISLPNDTKDYKTEYLFVIKDKTIHENRHSILYKIVCIQFPEVEYLIQEPGIKLIHTLYFQKIRII